MFGAYVFGHAYFGQAPDVVSEVLGAAGAEATWTVRGRSVWRALSRAVWVVPARAPWNR